MTGETGGGDAHRQIIFRDGGDAVTVFQSRRKGVNRCHGGGQSRFPGARSFSGAVAFDKMVDNHSVRSRFGESFEKDVGIVHGIERRQTRNSNDAGGTQLPQQIEAEIVEADAVVKGQTASSSYKPAVLDNGVRIMVPPHIESGTRIVVDVYEQTYVGKAG